MAKFYHISSEISPKLQALTSSFQYLQKFHIQHDLCFHTITFTAHFQIPMVFLHNSPDICKP